MASMLQREWTACSALVIHAIQWRSSLGRNWLSWTFLVLAVLVPLVAGVASGRWAASVGYGSGPMLAFVTLLWWILVVGSFDRQCAPLVRHLAPGTRRRALATLAGLWPVVSVALGGVLALAWGPSWLMLATSVAAVLAVVAALVVNPWAAMLVPAVLFGGAALNEIGVVSLEVLIGLPGVPVLLALGSCVAGACIVLRSLGAERPVPARGSVLPAGSFYGWQLRRDAARAHSGDLLLHAFGPRADPFNQIIPSLPGFLCLVIIVAVAFATVSSPFACGGLALLTLLFLFMAGENMVAAIYSSSAEQALVRCAPAAPASPQFNAALSSALLRRFGGFWLLISAVLLGVLYVMGVGGDALLRLGAVLTMPLLAAAATQRDYTYRFQRGAQGAAEQVWLLLSNALAVLALLESLPALFWIALAACSLSVTCALTWRNRRRMLAAPVAFPAGRMV